MCGVETVHRAQHPAIHHDRGRQRLRRAICAHCLRRTDNRNRRSRSLFRRLHGLERPHGLRSLLHRRRNRRGAQSNNSGILQSGLVCHRPNSIPVRSCGCRRSDDCRWPRLRDRLRCAFLNLDRQLFRCLMYRSSATKPLSHAKTTKAKHRTDDREPCPFPKSHDEIVRRLWLAQELSHRRKGLSPSRGSAAPSRERSAPPIQWRHVPRFRCFAARRSSHGPANQSFSMTLVPARRCSRWIQGFVIARPQRSLTSGGESCRKGRAFFARAISRRNPCTGIAVEGSDLPVVSRFGAVI